MTFYEWFNSDLTPFQIFLRQIGETVLKSVKPGSNFLSFRFPRYEQFSSILHSTPSIGQEPSFIPVGSAKSLIAAGVAPRPVLKEGLEKEGGKGAIIYKTAVANKYLKPFKQSADVDGFQKVLQKNLQGISREMGLLFEIEIFLNLVLQAKLEPVGDIDDLEAKKIRRTRMQNIIEIVKDQTNGQRIIQMVQGHGVEVAQEMINYTKNNAQVMNACQGKVNQVEFNGGEEGTGDISDIKIGCGASKVGFSIKFTSESKSRYRGLSPDKVYKLLGGKNVTGFNKKLSNYITEFEKPRIFIIQQLYELAKDNIENNPQNFTDFLNLILTNHELNMPVVRNYMRATGGADWSPAIRRDFDVSSDTTHPLIPLPNATVEVTANNTYVKLKYKVPNGSSSGTFITLEPRIQLQYNLRQGGGFYDEDIPDSSDGGANNAIVNIKINNLSGQR